MKKELKLTKLTEKQMANANGGALPYPPPDQGMCWNCWDIGEFFVESYYYGCECTIRTQGYGSSR